MHLSVKLKGRRYETVFNDYQILTTKTFSRLLPSSLSLLESLINSHKLLCVVIKKNIWKSLRSQIIFINSHKLSCVIKKIIWKSLRSQIISENLGNDLPGLKYSLHHGPGHIPWQLAKYTWTAICTISSTMLQAFSRRTSRWWWWHDLQVWQVANYVLVVVGSTDNRKISNIEGSENGVISSQQ